MGSYVINFTVYTMAMTGLIFFAVFVYKKVMNGGFCKNNNKFLSIEESMSINPRKSILVVRAGNEKFLIASDIDRTTMLSKLNSSSEQLKQNQIVEKAVPAKYKRFEDIKRYEDLGNIAEEQYSPKDLTPQKSNRVIDMDIIHKEKEPVRLELIKDKNPQGRRLTPQMDTREPARNQGNKTVVLDFDKPADHGFTTMKEMAKKINEL